MPYAILLNEYTDFDFEKTAWILVKAESVIYADATFHLKHSFGILAKNLPYDEAQAITDELNKAGTGCFCMDMNKFYRPPHPHAVGSIYCGDDFLGIIDSYGNIQPFFWPDIVLLNCGYIFEEKTEWETKAAPNLPFEFSASLGIRGVRINTHLQPSTERVKKKSETTSRWYLDIFSKQPREKHMRIISNNFNYKCLGDRKVQGSRHNFRILVQDICKYAKYSYSNRGVRSLMAEPPMETGYNSSRIFDEENLWLLQLIYINLDRNYETGDST